MTAKLTLSVDKAIIEKAKRYAQEHDKSLSEIVEKYLIYLTEEKETATATAIDPEVFELSDNISIENLSEIDEAKYRYLKDKYLDA